jgi:predicted Fe-Mo cluster-binding NifX family protein
MKVAIAATGGDLDSQASTMFGRSSHLIIVDLVDGKFKDLKSIPNPAANEAEAGIKTAKIVGDEKAQILISGSVGAKAFEVLKQMEIKTYTMFPGTVEENLNLLSQNKLEELKPSLIRGRGMGMGGGGRRQP